MRGQLNRIGCLPRRCANFATHPGKRPRSDQLWPGSIPRSCSTSIAPTKRRPGRCASSTSSPRKSVTSINLNEVASAPTEHKEIAGPRIALQHLLQPTGRNRGGTHISVVDPHNLAFRITAHVGLARRDPHPPPEGMGIIAVAVPSSPPPPGQDRRSRKYVGERHRRTATKITPVDDKSLSTMARGGVAAFIGFKCQ